MQCLISRPLMLLVLLGAGPLVGEREYWQQHVAYEIHVTLNDSSHTLSAREKLTYTNHSPDTLRFIWFHLWPNAYKNDETAFAKQRLEHYSTRFHFSEEDDRGYIDSLDFSVEGQSLKWEYHPEWIDAAKVYLNDPVPPSQSVTIETPFFVKLPIVFSRLGHSGKHYEICQWYPKPAVYDSQGWHPMPYLDQGEFFSEFGTFDVHITLPQEYRIMATGDIVDGEAEYGWLDSLTAEGDSLHALNKKAFKKRIKEMRKERRKKETSQKEEAEKEKAEETRDKSGEAPEGSFGKDESRRIKTLHFHQEKVHDFAWFADPDWIVRKGELWVADSTHKVTLWSMYLPKNAKLWERSIEYLHDSGYWYSRFYGDYPYNHITAVDGDMSAGGGMEYPNITIISSGGSKDLLEFVIMHEVGHNWFYGILGSDERDHAFLDEGLNEYTNIRYWEKKYPERNGQIVVSDFMQNKMRIGRNLDFRWIMGYLSYQSRAASGDDQPMDLPSTDFAQENYGTVVYGKTAIFTRYLQHFLGEKKMDEIMQDFYETWEFRHPSPADFRSFFAKHSDQPLDWFFDDAVNDTKVIDYGVGPVRDGAVTVTNLGSMNSPVELALYDRSGSEIERRWLAGFSGMKNVSLPEGAEKAVIDPDNIMPDINRENNATSQPLKFNFVFDQPTFHFREVNYLPWLNGNAFNGVTPGVLLYSGFIPGFRHGLAAAPMWDFQHQRLVGSVSAQRTFYRSLGFRRWTVAAGVSDYSGRRGIRLVFDGTIRKPIVSTPFVSIAGRLFFHDIDPLAVSPVYYSAGKFTVAAGRIAYSHRPDPFINYQAEVGLRAGLSGGSFARFESAGKLTWRHGRRLRLDARAWLGTFFGSADIPAQYQTWMGGGVDPDFERPLVFNRTTDSSTGRSSIYADQFIEAGPSVRGAYLSPSRGTAWAVNLDHTVPVLPLTLFADVAGASDIDDTLFDAGLKLSLFVVNLYLPFYQSWNPDSETPTDLQWILERMRFEVRMPLSFGGL